MFERSRSGKLRTDFPDRQFHRDAVDRALRPDRFTGKIDNSHTMLQGVSLPLATVTIQATTTLKVPLTFLTTVPVAAGGTFQFEDAGAALFSTRFYRAIYP
jgi:hypothetical protein